MSLRRDWIAPAAALLLAALGLVLLAPPAAHAATTTVINAITDITVEQIYSHGNGMVTLNQCDPTGTPTPSMIKTIDGLTNTVTQVERPLTSGALTAYMCEGGAVDATGTVFATKREGGHDKIAAYRSDTQLWVSSFFITPCGTKHDIGNLLLGTDGHIYVHLRSGCASERGALVSVDASTGVTRFKKPLNVMAGDTVSYSRFGIHTGGVVLFDNPVLRYFDHHGNEDMAKAYPVPAPPSGQSITSIAFDRDGTVFVSYSQAKVTGSPDPCTALQHHVRTVLVRRFDATVSSHDTSSLCLSSTARTNVTPDGGLVWWGRRMTTPPADMMAKIGPDGSLSAFTIPTTGLVVGNSMQPIVYYGTSVDLNGNIVVPRYGSKAGGDLDRVLQVLVFNPSGTQIFSFTSDEIGTSAREYFSSYFRAIALSPGAIHLPVCRNTVNAYVCNISANPQKLYKLDVPGLTIDYPRGAILGYQAGSPPPRKTVALGDSYISGEGVPPFLSEECHRSTQAYPLLLDYAPAANLDLVAFPACSGATTLDLTSTDPKQIDAIPGDADLILLSIGGNDIDFGGAAATCAVVEALCASSLQLVLADAYSVEFALRIAETYEAIALKAPAAEVIVIGYPDFLRKADATYCDWHALRAITQSEATLVDAIATRLNLVLQAQAAQAGFTFLAVDGAYHGHSICEATPYVSGVVYPAEYSYHPNAAGIHAVHEALLDLIA